MSKSGIFANFGSKEELQIALLDEMAAVTLRVIVAPAMAELDGLQRHKAIVTNWLGWTLRAGLPGGCPSVSGVFELDNLDTPVRDYLLHMDGRWRGFLKQLTRVSIDQKELRADLDVDQFVWEVGAIYIAHHVSLHFVRDPKADERAYRAFDTLLSQASRSAARLPAPSKREA